MGSRIGFGHPLLSLRFPGTVAEESPRSRCDRRFRLAPPSEATRHLLKSGAFSRIDKHFEKCCRIQSPA
jgi:hypothetical protein